MKTKKLISRLLKSTPTKIRAPIIRRMYKYHFHNAHLFEFTVAESFDDKIEASRIVQENYVKSGLSASEAELRISKHNLLPSTYVFIAKHKETQEIVATMSLIIHTSVGLPIEAYVNVKKHIADGKRAAELSSFSVLEEYRSQSNGLSIILMFYTMMYAYRLLGVHHTFISVRNSVKYFYKDMFFFEAMSQPIAYSGVNHVKGIPMYLNFPEGLIKMKRSYNHKKMVKNVYKQLVLFPWKQQCNFTQTELGLVSRFYFHEEEIEHLLGEKNIDLHDLTEQQKTSLESIYFNKFLSKDSPVDISHIRDRKSPRFLTLLHAIGKQHKQSFQLEIQEVSIQGIMARTDQRLAQHSYLKVLLSINQRQVEFEARIIWQSGNLVGLRITVDYDNSEWLNMLLAFDKVMFEQEKVASKMRASR